jgi:uncharacterized low-complexity protein
MKLPMIFRAAFGALTMFALATEGALAHSAEYCTVHPTECPHDPHAMKGQAEGVVGIRCPQGQVLTVNAATGEKVCVDKNMTVKGTGVPQNGSPH